MKTTLALIISTLTLVPSVSAQQPIGSEPAGRGGDISRMIQAGVEAFGGGARQEGVSLQQVTANWSPAARDAAKQMFDRYGAPQEVTANRLVWHDNRPWKSTTVINDDVAHNFPTPHADVLQQTLAIDVPVEKYGELAQFDGSVTAARTTGELTARCDKEENNYIALNLANDLITGKLSVQQARQRLVELTQAVKNGQRPTYAGGIQFSLPVSARTGDADHSNDRKNWQRIGW